MITEDYVSFETAKLLKEKGFNGQCRAAYTNYGKLFTTQIQQYVTNVLCSKGTLWECTAPTHQMAMRWLRENFNINPVPYALSHGWAFDIFDLSNKDITGCKKLFSMDLPSKSECYNSYEEAAEAAIKYYLENILKIS